MLIPPDVKRAIRITELVLEAVRTILDEIDSITRKPQRPKQKPKRDSKPRRAR